MFLSTCFQRKPKPAGSMIIKGLNNITNKISVHSMEILRNDKE